VVDGREKIPARLLGELPESDEIAFLGDLGSALILKLQADNRATEGLSKLCRQASLARN
jgi:hypothetical protein